MADELQRQANYFGKLVDIHYRGWAARAAYHAGVITEGEMNQDLAALASKEAAFLNLTTNKNNTPI